MNTAQPAPKTSHYMASHVMSLAVSQPTRGLAAALARCWLEQNWVRPAWWSWPMCRVEAFLWPLPRLEREDIWRLSFPGWQEERGVLF